LRTAVLILFLTPMLLFSEATVNFGAGAVSTTEYFTLTDADGSSQDTKAIFSAVKLKAGYGDIRAYAIEIGLGFGGYDKNIFSDQDAQMIYLDVAFVKAFDVGWSIYPFFKVGFGAGDLAIDRTLQNSLGNSALFAGGGVFVDIGVDFDLEFALLFQNRSWESIDYVGSKERSSSRSVEPYIGVNYRF